MRNLLNGRKISHGVREPKIAIVDRNLITRMIIKSLREKFSTVNDVISS